MRIQLLSVEKNKVELKGLIKLSKEIFGVDAGDTTDYWKDSIPFWIVVDKIPVGTTAAWANVKYVDGEDWEPEHDGWLYIGDLGLKKAFKGKGIEAAVVQHWLDYARVHNFKAISTNEAASDPLIQVYKAAGFKEVGRDEYFGPNDPNIILELELS